MSAKLKKGGEKAPFFCFFHGPKWNVLCSWITAVGISMHAIERTSLRAVVVRFKTIKSLHRVAVHGSLTIP